MPKVIEAINHDRKISDDLYAFCGGTLDLQTEDVLVSLADAIFSPDCNWIGWWVYDNYCGKGNLTAGYNKDLRPIKTLDDLWWLISYEKEPSKNT
jgi:hypothetical protein